MKEETKWMRIIYFIGIIALIIGALDPMEGSVVIAAGSTLIAFSAYITRDRHRKIFLASFILIATGVGFMVYLSSLGGIGGKSALSIWWGTLILPYPIGWLMTIITLICRALKKRGQKDNSAL
jgi:hypothetical protein